MKVTNILGYAMLLVGTTLAAPTEDAKVLEKRDGHINVKTWSGKSCGGSGQGTTAVGTGGKCVNSSNAGSIHIGGASAINPSGCKRVHAQYFLNTGCGGTKGVSVTYNANTCHALAPNQNSAKMTCVG